MYEVRTTAEIKKALVKEFNHKFSVTKGRGTGSHWIDISWEDGPDEYAVREFTRQFNDDQTGWSRGRQYTNESRFISVEKHIIAITQICEQYSLPAPEYTVESDRVVVEENHDLTPTQQNTIQPCNFYTSFLNRKIAEMDFRPSATRSIRKDIKDAELVLITEHIPGFFPTPRAVIDRMIELAEVDSDHPIILEPSAGKGDIADVIVDRYPKAAIEVYEYDPDLMKILNLKGYPGGPRDFLTYVEVAPRANYIFMTPPFEKLQDVLHVIHAYHNHLVPGGTLVAIVSEVGFFRCHEKAVAFREWLDTVDAYVEKLEDRAFMPQARIIKIEKGG